MSTPENENTPTDADVSEDAPQEASPEEQLDTSTTEPEDMSQQLRSENADLKDRLLRTQAELENFRRRTQKEAVDAIKYQALPIIRDFLPGVDNLNRAIDAAEQTGDTQTLIDGIKMVAQQFKDVLKAHSAELIDPLGDVFDPNLHEALSQVPSADHDPMTVLQVVEPGYRIHDRVIRPAKVIVTSAPPAE